MKTLSWSMRKSVSHRSGVRSSIDTHRAYNEHPNRELVDSRIVTWRLQEIQAHLRARICEWDPIGLVRDRRTSSETLEPNIKYPAAPINPYMTIATICRGGQHVSTEHQTTYECSVDHMVKMTRFGHILSQAWDHRVTGELVGPRQNHPNLYANEE